MSHDHPTLYIHGFGSSAHSAKGRLLSAHLPHVFSPSLSHIPQLAIETLETLLEAMGQAPLLVGSSLGGLYAYHLSARRGLPAVLINPALQAGAVLRQVLGLSRHSFDGSLFECTEAHLDTLRRLLIPHPEPARLLVLIQSGDELIDHSKTVSVLSGAELLVETGGSHAYDDLEHKLPVIRDFAERMLGRIEQA